MPLEGEVVDGDDRARTLAAVVMQIGRRQGALPIVDVHDIGAEIAEVGLAKVGGDARERREALRVVGIIKAVGAQIRVAGAVVEMRRVEHVELEVARPAEQHARAAAEQLRMLAHGFGRLELRHHAGIARHERAHQRARARHRVGQGARDVREAPGLDERIDLRRDGEDLQNGHYFRRSSIALVMSVTPSSVRRNRRASSSGLSPTMRPLGMTQPRSITTLRRLTFWPIST